MKKYPVRCPVSSYLCVMEGHWKPIMVWHMRKQDLRFKDFLEILPDISTKVLTEQLKELEEDKIVTRKVFKEIPPRVEYHLTKYGQSLVPVLTTMRTWGFEHLRKNPSILSRDSLWSGKLNQPLRN